MPVGIEDEKPPPPPPVVTPATGEENSVNYTAPNFTPELVYWFKYITDIFLTLADIFCSLHQASNNNSG